MFVEYIRSTIFNYFGQNNNQNVIYDRLSQNNYDDTMMHKQKTQTH